MAHVRLGPVRSVEIRRIPCGAVHNNNDRVPLATLRCRTRAKLLQQTVRADLLWGSTQRYQEATGSSVAHHCAPTEELDPCPPRQAR